QTRDYWTGRFGSRNEDEQVTPEEQERINEILANERLTLYQQRANELLVYASVDAFVDVVEEDESSIPDHNDAWWWQFYTWVNQDIIESISRANQDGRWQTPIDGPIKRVLLVDVLAGGEGDGSGPDPGPAMPGPFGGGGQGFGGPGAAGPAPVTANLATPIERTFEQAPTGRAGWPSKPNGYYDTVDVVVQMYADPNRLNQIIAAFESVNFQTVVDLDYTQVAPFEDRTEGYLYGGGPLAEVTLVVETLWLRDWVGESMPDSIREELQYPPR
ncbi:MAG: hypothetical protein AAGB34_10515, partial [Planctomycetota bacterium]